jgi:DNA polymerase-3 subunit beta
MAKANEPVMQFEVKRDALKSELDLVKGALDKKATIPALGHVHIETSDKAAASGRVRITCSDLDNTIRTEIEAKIIRPGSACVLGQKLVDAVERLPAGTNVVFSTGENQRTEMKCERTHFVIAGIGPDSFPEVGVVTPNAPSVLIGAERLLILTDRTSYAASKESARYALQGALFTSTRSFDRMVSTDTHRLAVVTANGLQRAGLSDLNALIPGKALKELPRLLKSFKGDVRVTVDESHIRFDIGQRSLISRQLTGEFPNWEMVVPKGLKRSAAVLSGALTQALRRVGTMAQDRDHAVTLSFAEGGLTLSAQLAEGGSASDVITSPEFEYSPPSSGDGEAPAPTEVRLNLDYLLDALSPLGSTEVVKLEFEDNSSPVVIRPIGEEKTSTKAIIMPLR